MKEPQGYLFGEPTAKPYQWAEMNRKMDPIVHLETVSIEKIEATPLLKAKRFTKQDWDGNWYCKRLIKVNELTVNIHLKAAGNFRKGWMLLGNDGVNYYVQSENNGVFDLFAHFETKELNYKLPESFKFMFDTVHLDFQVKAESTFNWVEK